MKDNRVFQGILKLMPLNSQGLSAMPTKPKIRVFYGGLIKVLRLTKKASFFLQLCSVSPNSLVSLSIWTIHDGKF